MPNGKSRFHSLVGKTPVNPVASPKTLRKARLDFVHRDMRRVAKARGGIEDKTKTRWEWSCGDGVGVVIASSRSDARGLIKKEMGIPKKGRLPVGTIIEKAVFIEPTT